MNTKYMSLLFLLAAGALAQASTNYFVKATGWWDDNSKWNANTGSGTVNIAPVNDPVAKVNSKAGKTITLTNSAVVGFLALNSGDTTSDVVINGGALRCQQDGNGAWNAVGYNKSSAMLIKNGGSWVCDGRLDVGLFDSVNGQANLFTMAANSGDVAVSNDFTLGRSFDGSHTAAATADILGGTLYVGGTLGIDPDGVNTLNLSGNGIVVAAGDQSAQIQNYILAGKITANGGSGTPIVDYNASNPGKTTLRAHAGSLTPHWQVAPAVYSTNELIITPFNALTDFGIVGDGITDVTAALQEALVVIANVGGGSLFLPSGFYKVGGNLTIPAGVTLRGDWKKPQPGLPITGTVLMAYAGRDNASAPSFITLTGSGGVNGIAVWYPEQLPTDIRPYPITFGNGGAATIENITLVNSWFGFSSYREGTAGRPFVRNIYGTPLKTGIEFDCIADIGRIESVHFSPAYWAGSGLAHAPTAGEHESWIYNNGTGIILRRLDWSYSCYVMVEGYNIGVALRPSRWDGKVPNGQSYGFDLINCRYGIYDESSAYAGYQFTRFNITGAETGVYIGPDHKESVMFHTCAVDASAAAFQCEGTNARVLMVSCDLQQGVLNMNRGYLSVMNSDFGATPSNHIVLGSEVQGASILGNRFAGAPSIADNTVYPVKIDHAPLNLDPLPPYDYRKPGAAYQPAQTNLFVVTAAPFNAQADGVTDDTPAFSNALAAAAATGGGTVFVPGGNYRLDGTLTVPSGVELRGVFDIPHGTNIKGSLLNIYSGHNVSNGVPFIQLEAGAGIKGLNFHYPNQIFDGTDANGMLGFVPYPYMIRGLGSEVYVVNISATLPYELLDLGTYQCDRHYVDYIFSTCLKTGIRVGGGSDGGQLHNVQFNPNSYTFQNGVYDSIPAGTSSQIHLLMKRDATPYLFGHMTNEVVHECFVFSGARGMHLVEENGQGPSGHCLGMGVDAAIHAFQIDKVGAADFQPINSQIVATDGIKGRYLVAGAGLSETFSMFSSAGWGAHQYSAVIQGGHVKLQNFHLARDGETGAFKIENSAHVESYAGNLDDFLAAGKPFLTIAPTATALFAGNILNTVAAQMPTNSANVTSLANLRLGDGPVAGPFENRFQTSGDWANWINWTQGRVPGTDDNVTIEAGRTATVSSAVPDIRQLRMNTDQAALVIDGGHLRVTGSRSDWHSFSYSMSTSTQIRNGGSLTFEGQTNHRVFLGYIDDVDGLDVSLTMEGGSLVCPDWLALGFGFDGSNTATVHAVISGGTVQCGRLYIDNDNNLNGKGSVSMDVAGGTVIVNGDIRSDVAAWESDGRMTAYGGAGTLVVDYNVSLPGKTTVTAQLPAYGYDAWAGGWGVDIGADTNDFDADLRNNFYEYVLNGDPTNALDSGVVPILGNDGSGLLFIYLQRNDDTNLIYEVETAADLISNVWTNSGYTVLGTHFTGGVYDEVTNAVPTVDAQRFIRLKVRSP